MMKNETTTMTTEMAMMIAPCFFTSGLSRVRRYIPKMIPTIWNKNAQIYPKTIAVLCQSWFRGAPQLVQTVFPKGTSAPHFPQNTCSGRREDFGHLSWKTRWPDVLFSQVDLQARNNMFQIRLLHNGTCWLKELSPFIPPPEW